MTKAMVILGFGIFMLVTNASGQGRPDECVAFSYDRSIAILQDEIVVARIAGVVVGEFDKSGPPTGICVGVFRSKSKRLVRLTAMGDDGSFDFGTLANGNYRLVVKQAYPGYCTANIPIKVRKAVTTQQKIRVGLVAKRLDSCSYAEPY